MNTGSQCSHCQSDTVWSHSGSPVNLARDRLVAQLDWRQPWKWWRPLQARHDTPCQQAAVSTISQPSMSTRQGQAGPGRARQYNHHNHQQQQQHQQQHQHHLNSRHQHFTIYRLELTDNYLGFTALVETPLQCSKYDGLTTASFLSPRMSGFHSRLGRLRQCQYSSFSDVYFS